MYFTLCRESFLSQYRGSCVHWPRLVWPWRCWCWVCRLGAAEALSGSGHSAVWSSEGLLAQGPSLPSWSSAPKLAGSMTKEEWDKSRNIIMCMLVMSYRSFKCLPQGSQFVEDAAKSPNVWLLGILLSLADLGGYVTRSSNNLPCIHIHITHSFSNHTSQEMQNTCTYM